MLSFVVTALLFGLILGVVINIHELGHFFAAKSCGMKVEEFSFGFGPKLFSRKVGDTEYILKLFPIGGYVKILGEESSIKSKHSFSEKSPIAKIWVAFAGVLMNSILAVILIYVVLIMKDFTYSGIPYYEDFNAWFGQQEAVWAYPVTVVEVDKDGGLEYLDLEVPFEILSVNGNAIAAVEDLRDELSGFAGESVELEIHTFSGDTAVSGDTVVEEVDVSDEGTIGVYTADDIKVWEIRYTGVQKYLSGFLHYLNMVETNFFVIGKLIGQSFSEGTPAPVVKSFSGPIGVFAVIDIVKKYGGLVGILDLTAMLNLALAITNCIPFPALDGGHVAVIVIEAIRGKPLDEKLKNRIFGIGMILLFGFIILISIKDVLQFF
ncbi:MAG: M50 family metallopeptidase [Patescibacteria group bacterium]|nr:M50 family metallopeptidase [Patescibacteria group bacterium]